MNVESAKWTVMDAVRILCGRVKDFGYANHPTVIAFAKIISTCSAISARTLDCACEGRGLNG